MITNSLQPGFSSKEIREMQTTWPQITWKINPPEAHHRLGSAEALVKAVKRSLKHLPVCRLSVLEFNAAIKSIAASINNRPLGFSVQEDKVLTPNHLLLGRTYDPVHPPAPLVEAPLTVLHNHVKSILESWFQRWQSIVLPNLMRIPKWNNGSVQLQPDDICILHQRGGKWSIPRYKYCKVLELLPSERDGRTRNIRILYYNSPSKKPKTSIVDIRNISPIPQIQNPI